LEIPSPNKDLAPATLRAGSPSSPAPTPTRRADVLNRGFSGYNTRFALDILPSLLGSNSDGDSSSSCASRPLFFTVLFGSNDASLLDDSPHCQHVPIDEYEDNMRQIVKKIRDGFEGNDKPPIILITPPPIDRSAWDKFCFEGFGLLSPRTNEVTKQYGIRVKSIAEELGCSVVDAFSLLGGNNAEEIYGASLEDGLHLNGPGNKLLFEGLMDVITTDFPDLAPIEDGNGKNGDKGIRVEGALWRDMF